MVATAFDSLLAGSPEQVADTILGELIGGSFSQEVTCVLIHAGLARLLAEEAAGGVRELVRVLAQAPRPLPDTFLKAVEALQPRSGWSEVGRKGLALARLEAAVGVSPLSTELARLTREGLRPRQLVDGWPQARASLSQLGSAKGWGELGALAPVRALRAGASAGVLAARRGQLRDGEASPDPNDTTPGRSAAHHS